MFLIIYSKNLLKTYNISIFNLHSWKNKSISTPKKQQLNVHQQGIYYTWLARNVNFWSIGSHITFGSNLISYTNICTVNSLKPTHKSHLQISEPEDTIRKGPSTSRKSYARQINFHRKLCALLAINHQKA